MTATTTAEDATSLISHWSLEYSRIIKLGKIMELVYHLWVGRRMRDETFTYSSGPSDLTRYDPLCAQAASRPSLAVPELRRDFVVLLESSPGFDTELDGGGFCTIT
jgi:hypothetical protein